MSTFNPDAFLNEVIEGANETKFTPPPVGDGYRAYIEEVKGVTLGDSPALSVTYNIIDENVKAELGMDRVTVRDNIFLDFEADGRLSTGKNKNVKLGALREAVDQNTPGPWSPSRLIGAGPVLLKISHRFSKTGEGPFANVDRVTHG